MRRPERTRSPVPARPVRTLALALGAWGLCACSPGPGSPRPVPVREIFGETGTGPGQFFYPRAMDAQGGTLWVVDKSARVQRIDARTGRPLPGGWTMPDYALGKPTGLTVGPGVDGAPRVYIADTHYSRVLVYRPDGAPVPEASIGAYGQGPGQFIYPTDVAVEIGESGRPTRLYVSEYGGNDRISVFSPDGTFQFQIGAPGTGPGAEFHRPQAVELVGEELIVADHSNHRVGRFTTDGSLIAWLGDPAGPSAAPGGFRYPIGLEPLDDGTVLVAEFGNDRVQRIDPGTGACLGIWGVSGSAPGQLRTPWAVAVIGPTMFILDSGNDRIQTAPAPQGARR